MGNQSNSLCVHVQCCVQAVSMRFPCVARVHKHYRMLHQYWSELIKSPVAINHIPKCQGPGPGPRNPFPGFVLFSVIHRLGIMALVIVQHVLWCMVFLDAHVRDTKSPEPSLSPQIIRMFLDKVDRVIGHTIVSSILVPSMVLSNEKWKVVSSHS